MLLNINGLDKATLLVALFNNAKKSVQTTQTIKKALFPAKESLADSETQQLNTILEKLRLSTQQARELISADAKFQFISSVYIGIDLSGDSFDSTEYDRAHASQENAAQILNRLSRQQHTPMSSSNKKRAEQLMLARQKLAFLLGSSYTLEWCSSSRQLSIPLSSKVSIHDRVRVVDLLKSRRIDSKISFVPKLFFRPWKVNITLKENLDSLLRKMDTAPIAIQGDALLSSNGVATDKRLTLIFDIDNTIATAFPLVGVRGSRYLMQKGTFLKAMGMQHLIYPGVIELIQYLNTKPFIQIAFFSAGLEERNKPLVDQLLTKALGDNDKLQHKNPIKILSRQNITWSDPVNKPLRLFMYNQEQGEYTKDILKVIGPGDLSNAILIDDSLGVVGHDQVANFLLCPPGPIDFRALEKLNYTPDEECPHQFNTIFYLAGVLSKCIDAFERGGSVSELLLNLQYKPSVSRGIYEHRKDIFTNQSYYQQGLETLRKVNPNMSFVTSSDCIQCTASDADESEHQHHVLSS